MLRHGLALILVFTCWMPLSAEPLTGYMDVLLGDKFDTNKALGTERKEGEAPAYLVRKIDGDPLFQKLFVLVHPKSKQIYRVIVRSKSMQPLACGQQQEKYLKQLQARHEGVYYHTMEYADMFQEKHRSAILYCDNFENAAVLLLEYHDEKLDPDVQR